jgi:hypothetical protein
MQTSLNCEQSIDAKITSWRLSGAHVTKNHVTFRALGKVYLFYPTHPGDLSVPVTRNFFTAEALHPICQNLTPRCWFAILSSQLGQLKNEDGARRNATIKYCE